MLDGFFGMMKATKNWHQIFWVWFTENSSKRSSTVYFSGNTVQVGQEWHWTCRWLYVFCGNGNESYHI